MAKLAVLVAAVISTALLVAPAASEASHRTKACGSVKRGTATLVIKANKAMSCKRARVLSKRARSRSRSCPRKWKRKRSRLSSRVSCRRGRLAFSYRLKRSRTGEVQEDEQPSASAPITGSDEDQDY